jgi:large subunit ribosomal protein L10
VTPAQILHTFAKKNEHIKLSAGVLEGNVLQSQEVVALAKLPSKQQLLGMLVGVLAGPIRGFASVLNGVQCNTVYVLTAIKDKKSA